MASNGLEKKAIKGRCRMCQRVRFTGKQVKPVGEVHHGFATGYIWECIDTDECDKSIELKLNKCLSSVARERMLVAVKRGRFKEYNCFI